MRIHDISLPIVAGKMPVWPGDPPVERTLIAQIGAESAANVSAIRMSVHTGTHVDAPVHFISGGAAVEALDLDALVGPCLVCEVSPAGYSITARHLEQLGVPEGTQRLLLKTRNSRLWARSPTTFRQRYVALAADAAQWLAAHAVRLVGVDYLSVEASDAAEPIVHRTLLAAGVIPLEGVNLAGVAPGAYTLVCLPLRIKGSDGAPARAILIET